MTIRTIITDAANAIARIAGRAQLAARVDATCANAIRCLAPLMVHPLMVQLGQPKHLPVPVSQDRDGMRDLTRAPFPGYAATRTGRRSC